MEFLKEPFLFILACGLWAASCGPPGPIVIDDNFPPCETTSAVPDRSEPATPFLLWKSDIGSPVDMEPAFESGFFLIPVPDNKLYIISANTGQRSAEIRFREPLVSPVAIMDSLIACNIGGKRLLIENWVSRKKIWQADLDNIFGKPAICGSRLFWVDGMDYLRCFDVADGRRNWDVKLKNSMPAEITATVDWVVLFNDNGRVTCFDQESGEMRWVFDVHKRVRGPAAVDSGQLLFATIEGTITRMDMNTGDEIWSNDLKSPIYGGIATDGQGVYAGTNNRFLVRLDFDTGSVDWMLNLEGPVKASPALYGDLVICGALDHIVYFVDKKSGEILYSYKTEGMLTTRPIVCGDRVYVAGEDQFLYCFQTGDGR